MALVKEKIILSIQTDFPLYCNVCKGKDGNQNEITTKKFHKDLLCLEHQLYLFYAYVYGNNFPKDSHLNQGFNEHCVRKWDAYMNKSEYFIVQTVLFMGNYQLEGDIR